MYQCCAQNVFSFKIAIPLSFTITDTLNQILTSQSNHFSNSCFVVSNNIVKFFRQRDPNIENQNKTPFLQLKLAYLTTSFKLTALY